MRVRFTKMQGAGNDFVVFDATRQPFSLTPDQMRRLGDRRFGVGCDQILVIEPATTSDADFGYRIFNNTGDEVEHCGNGARCFCALRGGCGPDRQAPRGGGHDEPPTQFAAARRWPRDRGHGRASFEHAALPLMPSGLTPRLENGFEFWPVEVSTSASSRWATPRRAARGGRGHRAG